MDTDRNLAYEYDFYNLSLADLFYDTNTPVHLSKHRIWPCFFWVTFVVGMFGNLLVVYVLFRKKNLRTVTNLYLLNLVVGDILYLVTTIPNTSYWVDYWPFSELMCKLIHYMMNVTMSVTVLSVTAVGLDRHYAILYPVTSRQHRTVKKTMIVIASFWVISLAISSPAIKISKKIDLFGENVCLNYYRHPWEHKTLASLMFLFLYVIPQLALGICYYRIGKRLWFSMQNYNKASTKTIQTLRKRRRVVKMTIVMTICFAVCWLPVHLVELYVAFGTFFSDVFYEIKILAPLVPHLFISTNPIMYCFMSKTFRTRFISAFKFRKLSILLQNSFERQPASITNQDPKKIAQASDISNEINNPEVTDKTDFVDKAVNTTPKLKQCQPSVKGMSDIMELVDVSSAV